MSTVITVQTSALLPAVGGAPRCPSFRSRMTEMGHIILPCIAVHHEVPIVDLRAVLQAVLRAVLRAVPRASLRVVLHAEPRAR